MRFDGFDTAVKEQRERHEKQRAWIEDEQKKIFQMVDQKFSRQKKFYLALFISSYFAVYCLGAFTVYLYCTIDHTAPSLFFFPK